MRWVAFLALLLSCSACAGLDADDPYNYEYDPETNRYVLKKSPGERALKVAETSLDVIDAVGKVLTPMFGAGAAIGKGMNAAIAKGLAGR